MSRTLGFDIGGTKCAVVLGEGANIISKASFPTRGPELLDEMIAAAKRMMPAQAVGISCGGPLDAAKGIVLSPPNLPGWDAVPVVEKVSKVLGIPARLQNDADASALAEWIWGAGKGCQHMIFLTFGTGMGAGLILNGKLYAGATGAAGEVGHIRLAPDGPVGYHKKGSFEGFCSGGGIAQLAGTKDLKALASTPEGKKIFQEAGRRLGQGLAILIDALNPERIVIGGLYPRQKDLLWPAAEAVLKEEALGPSLKACRVLPAELGEAIGDYAALAAAQAV